MTDERLTVQEYAQLMHVHERTVWRWIKRGLLNAKKHGRHGQWRIKVEDEEKKAS